MFMPDKIRRGNHKNCISSLKPTLINNRDNHDFTSKFKICSRPRHNINIIERKIVFLFLVGINKIFSSCFGDMAVSRGEVKSSSHERCTSTHVVSLHCY